MIKPLIMIFMLCIALPAMAAEVKVSCTVKDQEGKTEIKVITIDEPKILVQERNHGATGRLLLWQEDCPYPPIAPRCNSYSLTLSEFVVESHWNRRANGKNADDGYERDKGYKTTISRIDGSYKTEFEYLSVTEDLDKKNYTMETGTCVRFKQAF